jgi:hypothetical protein
MVGIPFFNWLLRCQKEPELLKRGVILDKAEGGFVVADNVGTKALTLTFFTEIFFIQDGAAFTKGFHYQFAVFHFSGKKISLFVRRRGRFMMGHRFFSFYIG